MKTPKLVREAGDHKRGAPAADEGAGAKATPSVSSDEHDASRVADADPSSGGGEDA